ncbi:hypothetical protein [Stieleria marina]|uniref:Uncharacterized protein n=1 Tax=Stieleria marina TaxID=1930275 RepID=A0A517NRW6_9BACT|nr:hypothetical protein K239x_18220 [Planctomycetes bacterium K23_9]
MKTTLSVSLIVMLSIQFCLVNHAEAEKAKTAEAVSPVESRQTLFESGEGGYKTYRIPAIVKSTRDTLLAFAEGRVTGQYWITAMSILS